MRFNYKNRIQSYCQDCPDKPGKTKKCMKNKCFYISTGCREDDDCPKGRKVVDFKAKFQLQSFYLKMIF